MRYMGGKFRQAKYIVPLLKQYYEHYNCLAYYEPFLGGYNIMNHIDFTDNRYGSDTCSYLIALYQAIFDGWIPPDELSKEEYEELKRQVNTDTVENFPLTGFAGYGASFGARFFGSYATRKRDLGGNCKDIGEAKRSLLKIKQYCHLRCCSYDKLNIPTRSLIYCDPPYYGTEQRYNMDGFDTEKFWEWVKTQVANGNIVLISEQIAPSDFVSIWQQERVVSMNNRKNKGNVSENLFVHKDQEL